MEQLDQITHAICMWRGLKGNRFAILPINEGMRCPLKPQSVCACTRVICSYMEMREVSSWPGTQTQGGLAAHNERSDEGTCRCHWSAQRGIAHCVC